MLHTDIYILKSNHCAFVLRNEFVVELSMLILDTCARAFSKFSERLFFVLTFIRANSLNVRSNLLLSIFKCKSES